MTSEPRVTITDVRRAGFCVLGLREWCDTHDVNLRKLVTEGIPESEYQHIDDANLELILRIKSENDDAVR